MVEVPVGRDKRDHDRRGAREDAVRAIVLVKGLKDDHLVTRVEDGQAGGHHGLGDTAADRNLGLRVDRHAPEMLSLAGDRVPHHLRPPGGRVLVEVLPDGVHGSFLELGGSGEIRKTLGQVDTVRAMLGKAKPRHLPDDRLREEQ